MPLQPPPPPRLDPRLWALDRVLRWRTTPIVDMALADIRADRAADIPRGPVADRLFGGVPDGVAIIDTTADLGAWSAPLRVYRPRGAGPLPVVVFWHGGGWVLGNPRRSRWLCAQVARRAGVVVHSIGYRLAPEHRFPTAVEDAIAGLRWVVEHAGDHGGDADRLAVMGSSAGGNLAAVVTHRARDTDGPAVRAQVLVYPVVDATQDSRSMATLADAPMLTSSDMRVYFQHYTDGAVEATHPWLSPLHASSFAGLPPALIVTASHDPLRDEAWRYAERLRAAGVAVRAVDMPGMTHGYLSWPGLVPTVAARTVDAIVETLAGAVLTSPVGEPRAARAPGAG